MDTLRRVGSIRKSMRRQKKQTLGPDTNPEDIVPAQEDESVLHPSYFTLTCSDAVVTSSTGNFQPTHLKVVITRHRKTYVSNPVLWESSLKCHLTGAGVWHPPFVVSVSVSPPMRSKSKGTLRHKDAFVSLENVDLKGRRKMLAKARVNLSDYYVAASVSPVAFKLKLFPESSKISGAFVHFSVHRTDADPTTLSHPVDDHDECDVEASPMVVRRSSRDSSHYDDDSDDDFAEDLDKKFPPKNQSPVPASRPSTLILKNPITVKQPVMKPDNNNDAFKTSSATVVANRILETTSLRFSSSSVVVAEDKQETKFVSLEQKKNEPELDRNRLLAEPEDSGIDTPKKIVSGIVLPSGPPPPLPQRTSSSVSSQRNEKAESTVFETIQV